MNTTTTESTGPSKAAVTSLPEGPITESPTQGTTLLVDDVDSQNGLTAEESKLLGAYETLVHQGFGAFMVVGNALREISKRKLYRDKYKTFEVYCADRWSYQRAHAYRLMKAAELVCNLSPLGDIPKPECETQVRPLIRLPVADARIVWTKAVEMADGKSPSPKIIKQALAVHRGGNASAPAPGRVDPKTPHTADAGTTISISLSTLKQVRATLDMLMEQAKRMGCDHENLQIAEQAKTALNAALKENKPARASRKRKVKKDETPNLPGIEA